LGTSRECERRDAGGWCGVRDGECADGIVVRCPIDKCESAIARASSAGNGLSDEVMQSCSRSTAAAGGDEAAEAELLFAQVARVLAWMRRGEVLPTLRRGSRRWARLDAGTPIQHSVASACPHELRRKHRAENGVDALAWERPGVPSTAACGSGVLGNRRPRLPMPASVHGVRHRRLFCRRRRQRQWHPTPPRLRQRRRCSRRRQRACTRSAVRAGLPPRTAACSIRPDALCRRRRPARRGRPHRRRSAPGHGLTPVTSGLGPGFPHAPSAPGSLPAPLCACAGTGPARAAYLLWPTGRSSLAASGAAVAPSRPCGPVPYPIPCGGLPHAPASSCASTRHRLRCARRGTPAVRCLLQAGPSSLAGIATAAPNQEAVAPVHPPAPPCAQACCCARLRRDAAAHAERDCRK
jgi:hypothetical protein